MARRSRAQIERENRLLWRHLEDLRGELDELLDGDEAADDSDVEAESDDRQLREAED